MKEDVARVRYPKKVRDLAQNGQGGEGHGAAWRRERLSFSSTIR